MNTNADSHSHEPVEDITEPSLITNPLFRAMAFDAFLAELDAAAPHGVAVPFDLPNDTSIIGQPDNDRTGYLWPSPPCRTHTPTRRPARPVLEDLGIVPAHLVPFVVHLHSGRDL